MNNSTLFEGLLPTLAVKNKIWEIFSSNIEVAVVRDKAYLDWRYI